MGAPYDYPSAPRAVVPHRSRGQWAVWLLVLFALVTVVGPFVALPFVMSDPGPVLPVETRVDGEPALAVATCFQQMSLTAVRVSSPDGTQDLWAATGRVTPLPPTVRFADLPPGLTATSPWERDLLERPVLVSYELTQGDDEEPWFEVSDVVDFREVHEGDLVQAGARVGVGTIARTCDGR